MTGYISLLGLMIVSLLFKNLTVCVYFSWNWFIDLCPIKFWKLFFLVLFSGFTISLHLSPSPVCLPVDI